MNDAEAFYGMLKILFANPCLILMFGDWRTGKTDTSLLIGFLGLQWGLIDKVGSNIYTYDNPLVDYINSFGRLHRWLHADRLTKLFIFDEAVQHLPSKRSMSTKSVNVTTKLIPELSKGHGRIVFCAQTDKVDSTLYDSAFLRAIFKKVNKKTMKCASKLFESLTFTGLPRSPIKFDKDRLADFFEAEAIQYSVLSDSMKVAKARMEGWSFSRIRDELGIHPETAKRHVRKVLKAFFEREKIQVVNQAN